MYILWESLHLRLSSLYPLFSPSPLPSPPFSLQLLTLTFTSIVWILQRMEGGITPSRHEREMVLQKGGHFGILPHLRCCHLCHRIFIGHLVRRKNTQIASRQSTLNVKYRIAENFRGRKLSWIGEKYNFCGENFRRLLAFVVPNDATPPNLQRKLSWIATKPRNLRKFSPLQCFHYTVCQSWECVLAT